MNPLTLLKPPPLLLEFRRDTLVVLDGDRTRSWPLERTPTGRLSDACKARLRPELAAFSRKAPWMPRRPAWCAIDARGLSLRRIRVPAASPGNLHEVVALQIESEFPLPPEELAWGHLDPTPDSRGSGQHEMVIAAVRRDFIAEPRELLAACGIEPSFTVAGLARSLVCPRSEPGWSILDVAGDSAELFVFDAAGPCVSRILHGLSEFSATTRAANLTHAAQGEASPGTSIPASGPAREAPPRLVSVLESLLPGNGAPHVLHLTGDAARHRAVIDLVHEHFGGRIRCQSIESPAPDEATAALRGMRRALDPGTTPALLPLRTAGSATPPRPASASGRAWSAAVVLLLAALLAAPCLEAVLFGPRLRALLAGYRANRPRLELIDREAGFLRHLRQNQPPYTEALLVLAQFTPPGARIESTSMNRRGEVSLRGSFQNSQQVVDFRTRLVESGFFSSVVVEEQTPAPNGRQIHFRLAALWKPEAARRNLPILRTDGDSNAPAAPSPGG